MSSKPGRMIYTESEETFPMKKWFPQVLKEEDMEISRRVPFCAICNLLHTLMPKCIQRIFMVHAVDSYMFDLCKCFLTQMTKIPMSNLLRKK